MTDYLVTTAPLFLGRVILLCMAFSGACWTVFTCIDFAYRRLNDVDRALVFRRVWRQIQKEDREATDSLPPGQSQHTPDSVFGRYKPKKEGNDNE